MTYQGVGELILYAFFKTTPSPLLLKEGIQVVSFGARLLNLCSFTACCASGCIILLVVCKKIM